MATVARKRNHTGLWVALGVAALAVLATIAIAFPRAKPASTAASSPPPSGITYAANGAAAGPVPEPVAPRAPATRE